MFWRSLFVLVGLMAIPEVLPAAIQTPAPTAAADDPRERQPTSWLRGKALQLAAREQTISVNWQQVPLRTHLQQLSEFRKTAIFIDRRIDPQQLVSLELNDSTVEQILWRVADQHQWGLAEFDHGYYLGPASAAVQLGHLYQKWQPPAAGPTPTDESGNSPELPAAIAKRLNEEVAVFSADVIEPQVLLEKLCSEAGLSLRNAEMVPHDLWAPLDWPRGPLRDQLHLLLIGFDLTYVVHEDKSIEIVPLLLQAPFTRKITGLKKADEWSKRLQSQSSGLSVAAAGDTLQLTGEVDDLLMAGKAIAVMYRPPPRNLPPAMLRYTLNTKAQRGSIVASVAKQLSVQWAYPAEARRAMEETIEINVREIELADLMQQTLAGTGFTYRLQDGKLEIVPEK